jgi:dTMP kinase
LDDYDLAFHQRVRAGYHELAKQEPDRWVTVDARQSKEEIQTAIRKILKIRLALSS